MLFQKIDYGKTLQVICAMKNAFERGLKNHLYIYCTGKVKRRTELLHHEVKQMQITVQ